MSGMDLRPLSLGEILDRTFTLYRRNFLLFLGITAIPHLLLLAFNIVQAMLTPAPVPVSAPTVENFQGSVPAVFGGVLFFGIVAGGLVLLLAWLFSLGATVFAVSDLYLGRPTSIGQSFGRMRGELLSLFGVLVLNLLAVFAGLIFLFIPGIYIACRLMVTVPAALLENIGPGDSLSRSFQLTKDFAWRSFLIYLLYEVLSWTATSLFAIPFFIGLAQAQKTPAMWHFWLVLVQLGSFVGRILVGPFLTIATAVLYYDLRVRKEAFDLQVLMNPTAASTAAPSIVPKMFS
jgi:hypothetical protein